MIIVAAFAVIRSSAAPLHEKAAFVGFVLVEMVLASGQFWDATFGDGRTFIDVFLLAVILLLATPASAVTPAGAAANAARSAHASWTGSSRPTGPCRTSASPGRPRPRSSF